MRCCVPFCKSTADKAAGADAITFHDFPSDATLRMKWLRALGKHDQSFKESAVVCSQHFLDDEFCSVQGGMRQIRSGVIPSAVKLCMICLDSDRNLVSVSKHNLEDAYEKLTGHSICREGNLKQTLCNECAQRLMNFVKFRSKSLRARSAMMALVQKHETVTIRHIKQINHMRELLKSDIVKIDFAPDHCDLHIKEYNYEVIQTDPGNIMLLNASDAVKSGNCKGVLDGSGKDQNSKEARVDNEDVNIENKNPTECVNNMLDASIFVDTKLMDEALSKPLCVVESIKSEYSVSSEDDHNDDTHHEECGSAEWNSQLSHVSHTGLHSQQRESNQDMGGHSSADYPHTSVNMLPTRLYEMAIEKTENFQIPVSVNETEFKSVEKLTDKLQVNNPVEIFGCLNKQNFLQEYFCEHCEYKCSKRDNLVKHLKNHNIEQRLSCSSRDQTFKSKNSLGSHMKTDSGEKPFSCKLCEYKCCRKEHLLNHMRVHTGEKPFSCKLCEYKCREKGNLVKHMRIHTGEKPFSCKLCEYACREKGHLVNHMRIHSGEKPFSCKFCEYVCREKGNLVRHMRIHTGEKPFSCKFCEYVCREKGHLVNHMKIHTGEKPFSCKLCDYSCREKGHLVNHMRIHSGEKPFSCKFCEYVCREKGNLVKHMKIHDVEKPFSCKLCDYACKRKHNLVSHMRMHNGEKPFSCKLCGYACREKGTLVSHMRIHTGEKPFTCKFCDYACGQKGNLVSHMRIHTGEKPFSCKLCDYACGQKGNLISHMKIHTGEKPFACKLCDYASVQKGNLISHMKIHTSEKPIGVGVDS